MRHRSTPVSYRRATSATPLTGHRYVMVGQKDFYDWSNPADLAEYRTVMSYTGR